MGLGKEMSAFFDEIDKIRATQEKALEDSNGKINQNSTQGGKLTYDEDGDLPIDPMVYEEPQVVTRW